MFFFYKSFLRLVSRFNILENEMIGILQNQHCWMRHTNTSHTKRERLVLWWIFRRIHFLISKSNARFMNHRRGSNFSNSFSRSAFLFFPLTVCVINNFKIFFNSLHYFHLIFFLFSFINVSFKITILFFHKQLFQKIFISAKFFFSWARRASNHQCRMMMN